jgi:hypothetical protein
VNLQAPATQASRPRTVVVRAQAEQVDRRAILGLVAGGEMADQC